MGKPDEAIPLARRALAGREEALGMTHRKTLQAAYNLATILLRSAKYDEAEPLYRRVIAGREKVLGQSHPDTQEARQGLEYVEQQLERLRAHSRALDRGLTNSARV